MNNAKIIFYPVDNGNMILLKLEDKTTILIDINIRKKSKDEEEKDFYDVLSHLKRNLERDKDKRYFVDAFILTHLDKDHITGLEDNFYLGSIDDYNDDKKEKIVIGETWSSERFRNRSTKKNNLSHEAKAYNQEMRRRIKLHEEDVTKVQKSGDRAIILGGSSGQCDKITYNIGATTSKIDGKNIKDFKINILGPLEKQKEETEEDFNERNRGSVILHFEIKIGDYTNKILLTGDAEVDTCEYMNNKYSADKLEYDVLCSPHHCSMTSIGRKNDKDKYDKSDGAIKFLSHARDGAFIIASSKEILDDDNNPPHHEAKQEYLKLVDSKKDFICTGEYKSTKNIEPIILEFTYEGTQLRTSASTNKLAAAAAISSSNIYPHGNYER